MASLVGYLNEQGFEAGLIANVISVAAIFSLVGRIAVGYLLDKIHAPWVSAFIFAMAESGFAILLGGPGPLVAFIGAAFIATATGSAADIPTSLCRSHVPLREFCGSVP